jgi:hypothetical protein
MDIYKNKHTSLFFVLGIDIFRSVDQLPNINKWD